ncbi:Uncharacterised protein [uncultured Ruminococcus sp.]|uniref:DUF4258 domain-containing protein n=1 Tax=Massiliimalia timonensis TaxID=1987501 RepID=UPI0008223468|nr:DUF4258 domain-containing protein [Massiliimalia timonensis]SCG97269.1 Uncharacterised protein [uncultured Clostridium sp.]SCH93346.1 Uncharacterised protein [uncultured Ruminococcus sp.]
MIKPEELRKLCTDDTIYLTQHYLLRMRERGIKYQDIKTVLLNGDIIEQYEDDTPFPSCLVMGLTISGKFLHVVCGIGNGLIHVITAYYPSLDKFEDDYKTRKGR